MADENEVQSDRTEAEEQQRPTKRSERQQPKEETSSTTGDPKTKDEPVSTRQSGTEYPPRPTS